MPHSQTNLIILSNCSWSDLKLGPNTPLWRRSSAHSTSLKNGKRDSYRCAADPDELSLWDGSPGSATSKDRASPFGDCGDSTAERAISARRWEGDRCSSRSRPEAWTFASNPAGTWPARYPWPKGSFHRRGEGAAPLPASSHEAGFLASRLRAICSQACT